MKKLRSGYTTGACAAAAAKAATIMLIKGVAQDQVDIPFPDGTRVSFQLCACQWSDPTHTATLAAVIKDAGDDPDVTNRARIEAEVRFIQQVQKQDEQIIIAGGKGIGTVTKPGLAIPVGEPAVNPVPRKMIREAMLEALSLSETDSNRSLQVILSVPNGEDLAKKTLNHRLGIIGGLSILGTTGIVRPVSAEAWTATISASMNVACKSGVKEIVLSTGRTSELAAQQQLLLPDEAYVMMGDYLQFSLEDAKKHGFTAIHLAAMWAKVLKGAMRIPQTHVRHGALEIEDAISFLATLGVAPAVLDKLSGSNTAREIYERLIAMDAIDTVKKVCCAARDYCQEVSGLPVHIYLVHVGQGWPSVAGAKDGAGATSSRQIVETVAGNLSK
jgi:cobalt-precorrin-5B (C1)-methyltransferase